MLRIGNITLAALVVLLAASAAVYAADVSVGVGIGGPRGGASIVIGNNPYYYPGYYGGYYYSCVYGNYCPYPMTPRAYYYPTPRYYGGGYYHPRAVYPQPYGGRFFGPRGRRY